MSRKALAKDATDGAEDRPEHESNDEMSERAGQAVSDDESGNVGRGTASKFGLVLRVEKQSVKEYVTHPHDDQERQ